MKREDIEKAFNIIDEKELSNGRQFKLENGCLINIFTTGKVSFQGKNVEATKSALGVISEKKINKKVFVVYGRDDNARTQLEAMLRRWSLEPIILDQLRTEGKTIIEKLENSILDANYGIVLATPDDKGAKASDIDNLKFRVRQNVVLELGMLLSKIGRDRVAILLKTVDNFERPTDIDGIIYIPFKDSVEETGKSLAKEMQNFNYDISIQNL